MRRDPCWPLTRKPLSTFFTDKEFGKLKHIDVTYLWIQDEVRSHRLRVRRIRSEDNVADLGTKPLSKAVIARHCLAMGYVNMNQENVQIEYQFVAKLWGFQLATVSVVVSLRRKDSSS